MRGLMSDEEWAFFAPFLVRTGARSGRPPTDHRLILDAIIWIARTGAPWRDLDARFGKWSTVYRQFRRRTTAGVWDVIPEALNESGEGQETVQMIDSTIVRAHQHSAGAKKGDSPGPLAATISAVREVASRPNPPPNGLGLPVGLVLPPGETSDTKSYGPVMGQARPPPKVLIAATLPPRMPSFITRIRSGCGPVWTGLRTRSG
ncbi:IS5 family transposase [Alsobacter sp. KACC 23698]|uniref:IS5 family transposase n=1 Tax=Alsobacter sp. KACC 23698 TaxID=3149229 RepID=A0AAU7JJ28_9HYPH